MKQVTVRPIGGFERRVERDLAEMPSTDPANALPGLLYDWLRRRNLGCGGTENSVGREAALAG